MALHMVWPSMSTIAPRLPVLGVSEGQGRQQRDCGCCQLAGQELCNDRPAAPLLLLQATKEQCSPLTLHKTLLFEGFTHTDTWKAEGGELSPSIQIYFQSEEITLSYTE